MLQVEVDLFSGRPNPQWIITDADATRELLETVSRTPGVAAKPGTGYQGLGFREVVVSQLSDDPKLRTRAPRMFALGSAASEDFAASAELARGLVRTMGRSRDVRLLA